MSDLPRPDEKVLYHANDGREVVVYEGPAPECFPEPWMKTGGEWFHNAGAHRVIRALLNERAELIAIASGLVKAHDEGTVDIYELTEEARAVLAKAKAEERTK